MADSSNHELALRVMGVMRRPNQYDPNVTTVVIVTYLGNITLEGTTIVGMSDVSGRLGRLPNPHAGAYFFLSRFSGQANQAGCVPFHAPSLKAVR